MKSGLRHKVIHACLVAGLAVSLCTILGAGRASADDAVAGLTIEQVEDGMLKADPGHFMLTLKGAFPDDYRRMLERVLAAVKAGASGDDIRRMTASITSDVRRRHAGNVTSATLPKLDQLVAAQIAFMQVLQAHDTAECAHYAVKGPTDALARLMSEADVAKAAGTFATATFDAIADGEGKPKADPVVNSDATAVRAGLTDAGISVEEARALLAGTLASLALSNGRLCDVGLKFLQVLAALPDDSRRRVLAAVLAGAAGN